MKKITWLKREAKFLQNMIPANERVLAIVRQHKLDFSPLYPAVIIATERHLLVCNRWFMGLKNDISLIPYSSIVSYRVVNGIIFSGIMIRVHGSSKDKEYIMHTKKEEGEIKGLAEADAMLLINAITTSMRIYRNSIAHGDIMANYDLDKNYTISSEGQRSHMGPSTDDMVAGKKQNEAIANSKYVMIEHIF